MNPMTNKFVANKFNLSSSNLHRIIMGRHYAGGSTKTAPEDHGERFIKVAKVQAETVKGKGKGKGKSSATASVAKGSAKMSEPKVTVARVTKKLIDLQFLENMPAEGTRGAKRWKKDDNRKGQK